MLEGGLNSIVSWRKRCDQKLIRKSIILLSNFRLVAILNNYSLWSWYAFALFENMTLILDNVRQSIANFSYIYTLSLLQEKKKKGKERGKKTRNKERKGEMELLYRFFSVKSMSTWCLHLRPFPFLNALSRSLKKVTSWSCSYIVNDALDAACRSLIHRVDITYVISLNAVYVQTFGIRLPNIKGKYWREGFKKCYRKSSINHPLK